MFELKGYIERELRENEIIIWNSGMSRFVLYLYFLFNVFCIFNYPDNNYVKMPNLWSAKKILPDN